MFYSDVLSMIRMPFTYPSHTRLLYQETFPLTNKTVLSSLLLSFSAMKFSCALFCLQTNCLFITETAIHQPSRILVIYRVFGTHFMTLYFYVLKVHIHSNLQINFIFFLYIKQTNIILVEFNKIDYTKSKLSR